VRLLAAVLLGLALASTMLAREPGFGEYRAVQESLRFLPPNIRFYELDRLGLTPRDAVPITTESLELQLVGKWGAGPSVKVTGRDSLVFLSRGSQVAVINYADTANPLVLSYIEVNGLVSRSVLVGNRLYVGSTGSDPKYIDVFDVTDPANPQRLGSIQTRLLDIDVVDTLVYTVAKDSFRVFDFSDPTNPRQIGACRDSGYSLSVCNGYAYIADRWGLYVVDVRDAASPHHEASWGTDLLSVKARGTICCVTTSDIESRLAFHILDIRQPSSIAQLSSIDSCGGYDIYLDGPLVFLSGFDTDGHVFRILNISDSTHPSTVGSCPTTHTHFGVWARLEALRAYVADNFEGLSVVDIANLAAPRLDTTMLKTGISYDLSVQDSLCYVASDGAGLIVLDASNLAQMSQIGILDSTRDMVARSVAVQDSFAYMSWGPARPWLRSISIADPAKPTKAGGVGTFDFPAAMVVRDTLLYVAQAYRFQVVNVARPRQPMLVGSCVTMDGTEFGLAIQDSLAYMVSFGSLQIVNVARPSSPFVVSTTKCNATGIVVRDTFAYIPYAHDTLWTFSVANPANPRLLSAVPASVWPKDVALAESMLFVGTVDNHVDIFKLDNPAQPLRVGRVTAAGDVNRLWYDDSKLYAAIWDAGVAIYETTSVAICEPGAPQRLPPALTVSPSISTGTVRFAVNGVAQGTDISVFDISGMRLKNAPMRAQTKGGALHGEIGFAGLPAGVYIIRVSKEGTSITAKVVITKGR